MNTKLINWKEVGKQYQSGISYKELGEQLGVSETTVRNYLKKQGIKSRKIVYTIEDVQKELDKIGYKVLSKDYSNQLDPLQVQCSKGHIYFTNFKNIRRGQECSKCDTRVGQRLLTVDTAKENIKQWKKIPARLYKIKLYDDKETFYKVGVTTLTLDRRLAGKLPYNYEVIDEKETNLYDGLILEDKILQENKFNRYKPLKRFDGYTEAFIQ